MLRAIVEREPEPSDAEHAPAPRPAKFRWPPKKIDVEQADRDFAKQARRVAREHARDSAVATSTVDSSPSDSSSPSVGAIFEEGRATAQKSIEVEPPAKPSRAEGARLLEIPPPDPRSWSAFEHAWLGVTSEPWSRRRQIAEFDEPGVACWRCASPIGLNEASNDGCSTCRDAKLPWERLVRVGAYDGQLRDTIREVKFKRFSTLGVALGAELGSALVRAIRDAGAHEPVILVPVAMPIVRRLRRGVDHSKAIAVGACRQLGREGVDAHVAHLLSRRHRPSQLEVAPSQRFRNAAGSFMTPWHLQAMNWLVTRTGAAPSIGPLRPSFGGTVIVIDDVRTTGATMAAACREMRRIAQRAGCGKARIWGGVVAVATHRGLELG